MKRMILAAILIATPAYAQQPPEHAAAIAICRQMVMEDAQGRDPMGPLRRVPAERRDYVVAVCAGCFIGANDAFRAVEERGKIPAGGTKI